MPEPQRRLVAAAVLAVCAAFALPASAGPAAKPAVAALLPAVATVHVKDFAYAPTPLTIHVGDRVTFVNDDDEAHTVTASDKSFDSEGLDTGGVWQYVFRKPGTYSYYCELHPYMKGKIVVLPAPAPSSTT